MSCRWGDWLTVVGDDARGGVGDGAVRLVVQDAVDAAVRVVVGRLPGGGTSDVSALRGAETMMFKAEIVGRRSIWGDGRRSLSLSLFIPVVGEYARRRRRMVYSL